MNYRDYKVIFRHGGEKIASSSECSDTLFFSKYHL